MVAPFVYVCPRIGRGDERSCVAGDHAGNRFSAPSRVSGGLELGGLQRCACDRSGAGWTSNCGCGLGSCLSPECCVVLWSDLFSVPLETSTLRTRRDRASDGRDVDRTSLRARCARGALRPDQDGGV